MQIPPTPSGGDISGSPPPTDAPATAERAARRWRRWLFPLILGVFATFFFGGALGKYNDDWGYGLRDPVTDTVQHLIAPPKWYFNKPWAGRANGGEFWRPLYVPTAHLLATAFWHHDSLNHSVSALVHACLVLALIRVMARAGIGHGARTTAGLLLLVSPVLHQTLFWSAAIGTSLAALATLVWILSYQRTLDRGLRWWSVPWFAMMAFAIPAYNEQPAVCLALCPLIGWASRPTDLAGRRLLLRGLMPLVAGGCAAVVYLTFSSLSGPARFSMLSASEWWTAGRVLFFDAMREMSADDLRGCLWSIGLETLASHPIRTGLFGAGLLVAGWAWVRRPGEPMGPGPNRSVLVFGAAGFAWLFLAWLPIQVSGEYRLADSRFALAPMLGAAIALAAVIELIVRRVPAGGRDRLRPLGRAGVVLVCSMSAVMLVGAQQVYRSRYLSDVAQSGQLVDLVPDPPSRAFFWPIRIGDESPFACKRLNRITFYSVWGDRWTIRKHIRALYKRTDLYSGCAHAGFALKSRGLVRITDDGLVYRFVLPNNNGFERVEDGFLIPWSTVIPFEVTQDGELVIVTDLEVIDGDASVVYPAPATDGLGVPARRVVIRPRR